MYIPKKVHFGMGQVPEQWAVEINVNNIGLQPAFGVTAAWSFGTDSTLVDPKGNVQSLGVVFPGQPLRVAAFTTKALIQHDQSLGLNTFLHLKANYRDIEGRSHYYVGRFRLLYEEGVGLGIQPIWSSADST